jgi:DNA-directed RNA polymerase alpha subunit
VGAWRRLIRVLTNELQQNDLPGPLRRRYVRLRAAAEREVEAASEVRSIEAVARTRAQIAEAERREQGRLAALERAVLDDEIREALRDDPAPVTELAIPRVTSSMTRVGIATVGDLVDRTDSELLALPHMGPRYVGELRDKLARLVDSEQRQSIPAGELSHAE